MTTRAHAILMIPSKLEDLLRRTHPGGRYAALDLGQLDAHLSEAAVRKLEDALNRNILLTAELVAPEPDYDRSFTCYVGRRVDPSWLEFNRKLDANERNELVENREQPLIYWVIQLSRLAPYWHAYWNAFRNVGGRVIAGAVEVPQGNEWPSISEYVRGTLATFGYAHVDPELLQQRVPWLTTAGVETLRTSNEEQGPTIYECLFSEVY